MIEHRGINYWVLISCQKYLLGLMWGSIHEGSLFVSHWDLPNSGASHHALHNLCYPLMSEGALRWFGSVLAYGARVMEPNLKK
jgi:hypothetical protein